jgi:hypothetical protein
MSIVIDRVEFLRDPDAAADVVEKLIAGAAVEVVRADPGFAVLEIEFVAPLELVGYPIELVRISQLADRRHPVPYAMPVGSARTWLHRYPVSIEDGFYGQLCLWYPPDPSWRIWTWDRGLVDFVAITQRHLWLEEFYRREGYWPLDEAPHGDPLAVDVPEKLEQRAA